MARLSNTFVAKHRGDRTKFYAQLVQPE